MPWNGSGTFNLDPSYSPEVNGTTIDAVRYNGLTSDIASGVTNALAKDGQNAATANISFGGFKATNLAAATTAGDGVRFEQIDMVGSANIATAATCSIFAASEQFQNLTGTTTITSFGANTAGQIRYIKATATVQITYNATSMIIPGAGNLTLTAGDRAMVIGLGSSNAEILSVTRASGLITLISDLGNANQTHSISMGNYRQTWTWAFTAANQAGLYIAGQGSSSYGYLFTIEDTGGLQAALRIITPLGPSGNPQFSVANGQFNINGGTITGAGSATNSLISAGHADSAGASNGGQLTISAGNGGTAGGTGGNLVLKPGSGSTTGSAVLSDSGTTKAVFTANATNAKISGTVKAVLDSKALFIGNTNGSPTLGGTGGAGATIAGSDVAFEVVAGTGSPTSFTATFANAKSTAPQIVICSTSQAGCRLNYAATTTTVQISTDSAWSSGAKISVLVLELQ